MSESPFGGCCTCTPVAEATYGPTEARTPTEAVIAALADAADADPMDLPPLYESVDPDVLDRLLGEGGDQERTDLVVRFSVERWNVFVRGDGRVVVCDATRPAERASAFEKADAV